MVYSLVVAARVGAILPRDVENAAKIKHSTRDAAEAAAVTIRKNANVAEVWIEETDANRESK